MTIKAAIGTSIFNKSILLIMLVNFLSCQYKHHIKREGQTTFNENDSVELFLFKDSAYSVKLRSVIAKQVSQKVRVELLHKQITVLVDTLSSFKLEYELTDMNNDRILDLLILKNIFQSNPSYYLYIIDTSMNRLHFVSGFDKIYTPQLEKSKNVIVSYLRSGTEFRYAFYKLNKDYELLDLLLGFKALNEDDASKQYNATLNKIRK